MGQPAARARVDTSAHTGPIQSGSPDVIIGGFPAARKNDPLSCSQHGQGVIVGGSTTVFVNGLPLARMGDKTLCNSSGAPAAPQAKAAPPQYWSATLAKKAGEDGAMHGDNYDARVLGAYASIEDKDATGKPESVSAGFALEDITVGNMKSQDMVKGELRTKIAVANAGVSMIVENPDYATMNASATATGMQYGASAEAGKEGMLYGGVGGDFTVGTAEAKVVSEVYKGNKGRYGFSGEVGAEAAGIKGEVSGKSNILGIISSEGKVSGTVGGVGASTGGAIIVDKTDYSLTVKASGKLAFVLGIGADVNIKVALKPILDFPFKLFKKAMPAPSSGDGTIKTGCVTVLIGG
ncbi:PAAR domain-containing protein [Franconibacter helveticus]|uniref:PAAR domain-containing protein n=1 Tax=Franconibacter helveticus TaxID=357240 RepID=UPI000DA1B983|nr:PAAR domain-containing protein [Franconibacter helveticus]